MKRTVANAPHFAMPRAMRNKGMKMGASPSAAAHKNHEMTCSTFAQAPDAEYLRL